MPVAYSSVHVRCASDATPEDPIVLKENAGDEQDTKKGLSKVTLWFIMMSVSLGLVFGLALAAEFLARAVNKSAGVSESPLLLDLSEKGDSGKGIMQVGGTTQMSYLDPHLGFAHNQSTDLDLSDDGAIPGFVVYGNSSSPDALNIVALGGSTTDPIDRENWPMHLHKILTSNGWDAKVYNGGVSGYSSNQELLKLIRDVLPLDPDIVLSLSGINDLGFMHSINMHPMVHPYQQRVLDHLLVETPPKFMPNTMKFISRKKRESIPPLYRIEGRNLGTETSTTPAAQWARNVRLMHTIAAEMGTTYYCFLQPVLGVGSYVPTPQEIKMLDEAISLSKDRYGNWLREFYTPTIREAAVLPFVEDITDVFGADNDLYRDARHPNGEGYKRIAERIYQHLVETEALANFGLARRSRRHIQEMKRLEVKYSLSPREAVVRRSTAGSIGSDDAAKRFGWSYPTITKGRITHYGKSSLYLHGWYASSQLSTISVRLNDTAFDPIYVIRNDIEEKFSMYRYRTGWICEIPKENLREQNSLTISMDGIERMSCEVLWQSE